MEKVSYIVRFNSSRYVWGIYEDIAEARAAKALAEKVNPFVKYIIVMRVITDTVVEDCK